MEVLGVPYLLINIRAGYLKYQVVSGIMWLVIMQHALKVTSIRLNELQIYFILKDLIMLKKIVLALLVLLPGVVLADSDVVNFEDAYLEQAIASKLEITGDITESDMLNLESLDYSDLIFLFGYATGEISSLRGIEYASNITTLAPGPYSSISDLSPVTNLSSLQSLSVCGNVSDLSPVTNLSALQSLAICGNVSNLLPIQGLKNLNYLCLSGNQISDISPIAQLGNLKGLDLGRNQISDITALGGLSGLEKLSLNSNYISNFSVISNFENLLSLDLGNTGIDNLSVLEQCSALEMLHLNDNPISDISSLINMEQMTYLDLSATEISDISSVVNMLNLEELILTDTNVEDISILLSLPNLRSVYLMGNPLNQDAYDIYIPELEQRGVWVGVSVPEPITLALFGIGGLLLRSRKRQVA